MIATGYDLPFRMRLEGVRHGAAQQARLMIRIGSADGARWIARCVDVFVRLANAGALGGSGVAPWQAELGARPQPQGDPALVVYDTAFRLPAQAWVVLAHLLARHAEAAGVRELTLVGREQADVVDLSRSARGFSTYPGTHRPVPFALDDQNPEGGSYSLFVRLESSMDAGCEAALNGWLGAWVDAVRGGGYALAPTDPAGDYVEPHLDHVESYEDVVEWTVYKLRADPVAAIAGLINIFENFHWRCQPIRSLEIG